MNFSIFDDDFELDKEAYIKELAILEKEAISPDFKEDWENFVKTFLKDTRNFFLMKTSLKTIISLKQGYDYDSALFSSFSFLPDQTFVETAIMLVVRFSDFGEGLAKHFGVEIEDILNAKIEAKKAKEKKKKEKQLEEKKEKINKLKENIDVEIEEEILKDKNKKNENNN